MYILRYLTHIMLAYLYKLFCTYLHLLYSNIYCNSFLLYGAPFLISRDNWIETGRVLGWTFMILDEFRRWFYHRKLVKNVKFQASYVLNKSIQDFSVGFGWKSSRILPYTFYRFHFLLFVKFFVLRPNSVHLVSKCQELYLSISLIVPNIFRSQFLKFQSTSV